MCVEKTCLRITSAPVEQGGFGENAHCECLNDPKCFWNVEAPGGAACVDKEYGKCPTLDLVLVVDGSGSMEEPFGRHANGFMAMMEMLRDWVANVPLSGEAATVGSASTLTEKLRVAIVQFSGSKSNKDPTTGLVKNSAKKTPGGVGTGGRLSGVNAEVSTDVDWHEANFMRQGTYIAEGLSMGVDIFHASPVDGRRRALIILTDGEITDKDMLAPMRRGLSEEGVMVFGIVMRPFSSHTDMDKKAELALKPIVSTPTDEHFANLEIDQIPTEVLNGICDPNSLFGKHITKPDPLMGAGSSQPCPCTRTRRIATRTVAAPSTPPCSPAGPARASRSAKRSCATQG
jgi:hypothetical protein